MSRAVTVLGELGVPVALEVASAHRSPKRVRELVQSAEQADVQVFICGAGMAAHLAGAVAAATNRPVIGVPLAGSAMSGMDALLSTVQMPKGVPVATVAVGEHGATNAGILAAQILALNDAALAKRLAERYRRDQ
ncbi:MAG: 5-(carboxyamino)imidazole ribonucleotide mutase [candidate division Zixibacteria bacterium]|nr:5-(carboxyamino)imidazole ribonucleotide mutase [candidate division Zixibacteria bacterium]